MAVPVPRSTHFCAPRNLDAIDWGVSSIEAWRLRPRSPNPGHNPLPDEVPLELGDGGQDVKQEATRRRGCVDRLVRHNHVNPERLELSCQTDQIAGGAGEP